MPLAFLLALQDSPNLFYKQLALFATFHRTCVQVLALQRLVKIKTMYTGTVTYKCSSAIFSIIWPILFTITIILLNLIDCTQKKHTAEALPHYTANSSHSQDTNKEKPLITTTNTKHRHAHRGSYANALRRIIQLHLLLAVTRQCTGLWACDDGNVAGALTYGIYLIAGGALVCPHEANLIIRPI